MSWNSLWGDLDDQYERKVMAKNKTAVMGCTNTKKTVKQEEKTKGVSTVHRQKNQTLTSRTSKSSRRAVTTVQAKTSERRQGDTTLMKIDQNVERKKNPSFKIPTYNDIFKIKAKSSKMVEEPMKSSKTVQEPMKSSKTEKKSIKSSKMVQEPIKSPKMVQEPNKSSKTVQEPIKSSKTVHEPIMTIVDLMYVEEKNNSIPKSTTSVDSDIKPILANIAKDIEENKDHRSKSEALTSCGSDINKVEAKSSQSRKEESVLTACRDIQRKQDPLSKSDTSKSQGGNEQVEAKSSWTPEQPIQLTLAMIDGGWSIKRKLEPIKSIKTIQDPIMSPKMVQEPIKSPKTVQEPVKSSKTVKEPIMTIDDLMYIEEKNDSIPKSTTSVDSDIKPILENIEKDIQENKDHRSKSEALTSCGSDINKVEAKSSQSRKEESVLTACRDIQRKQDPLSKSNTSKSQGGNEQLEAKSSWTPEQPIQLTLAMIDGRWSATVLPEQGPKTKSDTSTSQDGNANKLAAKSSWTPEEPILVSVAMVDGQWSATVSTERGPREDQVPVHVNEDITDAVPRTDKPATSTAHSTTNCEQVNRNCEQVNRNCEQVNTNCEQVNRNCEQVNRNCEQVNRNCEQVNTNCEQVNRNCDQVNRNCEQVNTNCEQVNRNCEQVNRNCEQVNTNCEQVNRNCEQVNTNCEQVNRNCEQVNRNCEQVNTNCEQVNRNCEQVNTNCEQVNRNCEQVNTNCEQVNRNCEQVNRNCEQVNRNCEQVNRNCEQVNTNCEQVNTNCEQVNTNCEQVNRNCEQVNTNCEQVNRNCEQVNTNCEQVNTNCEQVNRNCEQVNRNCEQVNRNCEQVNTNCEQVNRTKSHSSREGTERKHKSHTKRKFSELCVPDKHVSKKRHLGENYYCRFSNPAPRLTSPVIVTATQSTAPINVDHLPTLTKIHRPHNTPKSTDATARLYNSRRVLEHARTRLYKDFTF